jgi:hypothetical protein
LEPWREVKLNEEERLDRLQNVERY